MKLKHFILSFFVACFACGQKAPDYYSGVNFNLKGEALKQELSELVTNTQKHKLSYTPGVWEVLKKSDLDPNNSNNVLLIYGSEASGKYARTRNKNDNGGGNNDWNREHVFAKALANPKIPKRIPPGLGTDVHHLRAADVQLNSDRGSLKFDDGRGAKAYKTNRGGWFPGDEWKGDVARMVMYMYIRYGNQCKLTYVALGPETYNDEIPDILLKWNAEDPVSDFEKQRNRVISEAQGNRNPFIDNPYLANLIWGGPKAENTWPDTFTTPSTPDKNPVIATPTNLQASNITQSSFTLTWDKVKSDKEISYDIYLNEKTFINNIKDNKVEFYNLTPNKTYNIYVIAKDAENNRSSKSEILSVHTLYGERIINRTGEAFTLYPNPIKTEDNDKKLSVDAKNLREIKWLKIFNLNGKLIKEYINPFIRENYITLPPKLKGIFIIKTPNYSKKVIIQ